MVCGKIRITVSLRKLLHLRKAQIRPLKAAVNSHSHQRLSKEIFLALADGMISSVVNQKYLDSHAVMDYGLKLLQIHLNTAVPGKENNVCAAPGKPGPDSRRQIVAHGGYG